MLMEASQDLFLSGTHRHNQTAVVLLFFSEDLSQVCPKPCNQKGSAEWVGGTTMQKLYLPRLGASLEHLQLNVYILF